MAILATNAFPRSLNDLALDYVFSNPEKISWSQENTKLPDGELTRRIAQFALPVSDGIGTHVAVTYEHRTQRFDCDCCGDGYRFSLTVKTDELSTLPERDVRLRNLTKNFFHLPMNRWAAEDILYEHDLVTPVRSERKKAKILARGL